MNTQKDIKQGILIGLFLGMVIFLAMGAAAYKSMTAPTSSTDNAIIRFSGTGGYIAQNSGVIINDTNGVSGIADLSISGNMDMYALSVNEIIISNWISPQIISNATPSRIAVFDVNGVLTNDVAETGTGAPVRANSPTYTGSPTYTIVERQPHSAITNFVLDPTVAQYQSINPTNLVVKVLHVTNNAAGKQSVFYILSGTNASVSVEFPTGLNA